MPLKDEERKRTLRKLHREIEDREMSSAGVRDAKDLHVRDPVVRESPEAMTITFEIQERAPRRQGGEGGRGRRPEAHPVEEDPIPYSSSSPPVPYSVVDGSAAEPTSGSQDRREERPRTEPRVSDSPEESWGRSGTRSVPEEGSSRISIIEVESSRSRGKRKPRIIKEVYD